MLLNHRSWIAEEHTRLDKPDGLVQTLAGGLDNTDRRRIAECFGADIVCFVQVAMKSPVINRYIEVENVSIN